MSYLLFCVARGWVIANFDLFNNAQEGGFTSASHRFSHPGKPVVSGLPRDSGHFGPLAFSVLYAIAGLTRVCQQGTNGGKDMLPF